MSLLSILKRFFSILVLPGDKATVKKHALAALVKHIARNGPHWYEPWSDRLTAEIIPLFDRLADSAKRVAAVLDRTIGGGIEDAQRVESRLVDAVLHQTGSSLAASGFDAVYADASTRHVPDLVATMDQLFQERLKGLRSSLMGALVTDYRTILRLSALCRYRYEDIPGLFQTTGGMAKYRSKLDGSMAVQYLEDLYFLAHGLVFDGSVMKVLLLIHEAAGMLDYDSDQLTADLQVIGASITGPLQDDALKAVIRAIHSDPFYEPAVDMETYDIVKVIAERLSGQYALRRAVMIEQLTTQALEARTKAVFGETMLLDVSGWTQAESVILSGAGFPQLPHIRALSVVKSFLFSSYADRIRPVISLVVVDLDFADVEFRRTLSDMADAVSGIRQEIAGFEQFITSPGNSEFLRYVLLAQQESLDSTGMRSANRAVQLAREQADRIMQSAFSKIGSLSDGLGALVEDIKSREPHLVYRVAFSDQKRQDIIKRMFAVNDSLAAVLDLLRMLSMDYDHARHSFAARQALAAAG
jgi:hypothetical protein